MRDEPLIQSMRYLFSLTISLKKAQVTCQETAIPPAISVKDNQLEVVNQFTYLGPTTTDNLSLEVELGIIYIWTRAQAECLLPSMYASSSESILARQSHI